MLRHVLSHNAADFKMESVPIASERDVFVMILLGGIGFLVY